MANTLDGSLTTEDHPELKAIREWLDDREAEYYVAIEKLKEPDSVRELMKGLHAKLENAMQFDFLVHPPHAAVAVVAQIQERMGGIFEDLEFLDEYEERRDRFRTLNRRLNKDG